MKAHTAGLRPTLLALAAFVALAAGAQVAGGAGETATASPSPASRALPPAALLEPGPPPLASFVGPLKLTPVQRRQLEPIFADVRARVRKDMDDARRLGQKLDEPEVVALLRSRDADLRERISPLLTPEQLTGYDALMAQHVPRRSATVPVHGHHEMDTPATAR